MFDSVPTSSFCPPRWSLVTDRFDTGHTRHLTLDTGHWTLHTRHQTLDTGHWTLDTGHTRH
eukprot:898668-Prorocentrum_minimum.AAC.3